jgi:hypothetical protein
MSDLYQILGADPSDSPSELRRRYLATIGEVHPDRALDEDDAKERTRLTAAVTAAWVVLGDPLTRAGYDRSLGRRRRPQLLRALRALLGRRRWIPGRPHPRIDVAPIRSFVASLGSFSYETRLGQWSLVVVAAGAGAFAGGEIAAAGVAATVGLLLAGAGEPTPIADARLLAGRLFHLPAALLRRLAIGTGGWLSPRLSEARGREQGYASGLNEYLERSKRSVAKEGARPEPPISAWPSREGRWRRRPRPPRRSGLPRSRRP